jgi:hypothetical protein
LNEHRSVYYRTAKEWIKSFNSLNASLKTNKKPLFTPTTVMKIGNHKYVFVIHKANINCKGHIFFKVSTEEIKLSSGNSKKILKLPCGHHDGVRFDIDKTSCNSYIVISYAYASCLDTVNKENGLISNNLSCFESCNKAYPGTEPPGLNPPDNNNNSYEYCVYMECLFGPVS